MPKDKLVIGHAGKLCEDAITLDVDPTHKPDVVHDLHVVPLPFEDNQFKEIVCHHVLEHLNDISNVMDELHRICKPNGTIYIEVPHHSGWCAHSPFHKLYFNSFAFDGYARTGHTWQTGVCFEMLKKEVTFHRAFRRLFLHKLFNANLMAYERFWTYICPAEHLKVWLRPVKNN